MKKALKSEVRRVLSRFEPYLEEMSVWERWPTRLAEAARYSLFSGGKRVRPCLALLSAEAMGAKFESAMPFAAAVEMVHTYSLIHDDLPSMDDDDLRRDQPTCHRKFDEATAILAGDALLTEAFAVISRSAPDSRYSQDWIRLLAEASGGLGMVGGQVEDIAGTHTLDTLIQMQRKKTGALICASVVGGGVTAGLDPLWVKRLEVYGQSIGLLFQLTDDLLDAEQDAEREANSFLHYMSQDEALEQRATYIDQALEAIKELGPKGQTLRDFVEYVSERDK